MTDEKSSGRGNDDLDSVTLRSDQLEPISSSSFSREIPRARKISVEEPAVQDELLSGVAAKLAAVDLPKLEKENRARLQMQTPNRLYFYWTLKSNPFLIANKAVAGGTGGYQLAMKLVNLTHETDEVQPAETSGSWWFDVDYNCEYRAEIGLYAANRPYIRIIYSNIVKTPRKGPSPRAASGSDWTVTAESFADVLSVSGFKQDAFYVAISGDDLSSTGTATRNAFEDFVGEDLAQQSFQQHIDEIRYVLIHLSLGLPVESLKWRIDTSLFRILQQNLADFSADRARSILKERFGVETAEIEEDEVSSSVYGASLINFPRVLRRRRPVLPDYKPVSSARG